jgi:hypothetical protein
MIGCPFPSGERAGSGSFFSITNDFVATIAKRVLFLVGVA